MSLFAVLNAASAYRLNTRFARFINVPELMQQFRQVTITRNEMLYALNQSEKFHLAIVFVGEHDAVEVPFYVRNPFDTEPGWGVSSINFDLKQLLSRATGQSE